MQQVVTVKCTHVVAQVGLGFYDAEGNLVGEEMFPQSGGELIVAKLFHPHQDQLGALIEMCVQQAWQKINGGAPAELSPSGHSMPGAAGVDHGAGERENSLVGR